ncbi:MAG: winged helix-turn-helix transcriptional regulator, partial [Bacteroidales bacterium]|nr:winged helix-turn-helix transcriptional regulator [Bacteroidales bacterium]
VIHQLICLLSDNPYISALQLADHLNKTERHIRRILSKLQSDGTIRRVGADKNGHWEVIDNQSEK